MDEGGIGYGVNRYANGRPERTARTPPRWNQRSCLTDPQTGLIVTQNGQVLAIDLATPSRPWVDREKSDEKVVDVAEGGGGY